MRHRSLAYSVALIASMTIALSAHAAEPYARSCASPDASLATVLARIAADRNFHDSRVLSPFVLRSGDGSEGDMSIELLGTGTVRSLPNPLFPSSEMRTSYGLTQTVTVQSPRYAEVYVEKPDTDRVRQLFQFRKLGECWYLEGMIDSSL